MKKSWKPDVVKSLAPEITVYWPSAQEQQYNRDFGGCMAGDVSAVFKPQNIAQTQQIITFASQQQLQLTPRCFGLSQSGQALAPSGAAILDLTALNQLGEINQEQQTIQTGPAVSWAALINATSRQGLIPYVQPFNVDLSIAGVLAAGGIGASSPFYGACSAHIASLQLITGNGRVIDCDSNHDYALMQAATSNLSRHSVITQIQVKLRPFKPKTRTFFLLYDDHETWLADQQQLAKHNSCDYIEAFCTASMQGMRNTAKGRRPFAAWLYALQISLEYQADERPELSTVNVPLNYWRLLHIDDNDTIDFLHRHDPRFAMMRQTGLWQQCHPWYEIFLDGQAVKQLLLELLDEIPLSLGGICHLFPVAKQYLPDYFMAPDATDIYAFTVLPGGVSPAQTETVLTALEQVHQKCLAAGGKRYLSGYLFSPGPDFWRQHYADYYPQWLALKKQHDPNNVFTSVLFAE